VLPLERLTTCAGLAVRAGLPYEEGWRAVTVNPATQTGIGDRVGSLAVSLDGDVVIWEDDPITSIGAGAYVTVVDGKVVKSDAPNGYKFEKFIFDILPNAKKAAFLAFDQKDEFSPVKNAEGSDSPATCRADMQAKWRRQLAAAGVTVPEGMPLEIDPVYALDAGDVKSIGLFLSAD
jgi:hypothetical protein